MIGLGMATAVFLDAVLVRTILVPAIMHLLGDRNWRLPEWLGRRLPHLDIEGEVIEPPRTEEVPVPA
jgi:RND superfamily putative drug exporter